MEVYKNKKGQYHLDDGPAYIYGECKIWFINGKKHREDGPAVINGDKKVWYINDERHRIDGPAYIDENIKFWYINGKRHREDGPAYIYGECKIWFINGIERDKEWVDKYLKIRKKHLLLGVIVSDYWKIREIILRWRYNPNLKCVQVRIKREFDSIY